MYETLLPKIPGRPYHHTAQLTAYSWFHGCILPLLFGPHKLYGKRLFLNLLEVSFKPQRQWGAKDSTKIFEGHSQDSAFADRKGLFARKLKWPFTVSIIARRVLVPPMSPTRIPLPFPPVIFNLFQKSLLAPSAFLTRREQNSFCFDRVPQLRPSH